MKKTKKEKKPGFTGIKELEISMKKNTTLYIFLILPIMSSPKSLIFQAFL